MVKISDLIDTYPDIYEAVDYSKVAFLSRLLQDGIIDIVEWSELMGTIGAEMILPPPVPKEKLPWQTRMGIALFDRIKDFFAAMWYNVFHYFTEWLPFQLDSIKNYIVKLYMGRLNEFMKYYMPDLTKTEDYPPALRAEIKEYVGRPTLASFFLLLIYGIGQKLFYISAMVPAIQSRKVREINKVYEPNIPDIATLISVYYKKPEDRTLVFEKAAEQGFSKEDVGIYIRSMEALFSVDDLRRLYLRGLIDDEVLSAQLKRAGWGDESITQLKALLWAIPGASDLVRFSVREAYYPDYIKEYGTDLEYPDEFEEDAKKIGVSPYWAHMYWRSHWELPPLAAAYEMLHRKVIEDTDLDKLFMAQDIMPWWREKLKAISYRVLTRVDVRRMYSVGVLDRAGVLKAYTDLGYNTEDAEKMTEFTIRYVTDKERDLTKADILGAYDRRLFSRGEAMEGLQAMGYDAREADLMISRVEYDSEKKKKTSVLKNLAKGYKRGAYTSEHVQARMAQLNMSGAEITEIVNLWDTEKTDDTRALSKAELDAMYKKRIIKEDRYREEMSLLGYQEPDIDLLVALHKA